MEPSPLKGLTDASNPFSGFSPVSPDFQSWAGQRCLAAMDDHPTIAAAYRLVLAKKLPIASLVIEWGVGRGSAFGSSVMDNGSLAMVMWVVMPSQAIGEDRNDK